MKEIPLTKGMVAIVDDADYERVACYKWHADGKPGHYYAYRNVRVYPDRYHPQRRISLHAFLMNPPDGIIVDHRDGNGLNCTRDNMRFATYSDNARNSRPKSRTSRYKGICYYKKLRKWGAFCIYQGKQHYLGVFTTPEDAARAYDAKAREWYGRFAKTNFPLSDQAVD